MVKVKATTILETVIAMTIILIVFLIAGTIFVNISKSGLTEKKVRATEELNNYFDELKISEIPYSNIETVDGFIIHTEANEYSAKAGVVIVYCFVSDTDEGVIAEQKRLMVLNNQQK